MTGSVAQSVQQTPLQESIAWLLLASLVSNNDQTPRRRNIETTLENPFD